MDAAALATQSAPAADLPRPVDELFVVPTDADDAYLVYAPLRSTAVLLNADAVNLLADLRDGVAPPATEAAAQLVELLRRLELVDAQPVAPVFESYRGEPTPTHVTLFLTTACSMRCSYCYASAGDTPLENMKLPVAQSGIDFIVANALRLGVNDISVAWHGGGEPTVNWPVLRNSYHYARELADRHGLALRAGLASNGAFKPEQAEWIVQHLSGCSISLDGDPETQDRHRPMANGLGSSERVERTLRCFDAHRFPYALRVTVTSDRILTLPRSIEYICERFAPQSIQVEPAYPMGRWRNAPSAETAGFIRAFRRADAVARRYGRSLTFSAARAGTISPHFCGVTQDSFALSPRGGVSACFEVFSERSEQAPHFFYGEAGADGGYRFDLVKLDGLRAQTVNRNPYCDGCFARWSCSGDCLHKNRGLYADEPFAGSDRCHIIRELTKDQILRRIEAAGGLFWKQDGSP